MLYQIIATEFIDFVRQWMSKAKAVSTAYTIKQLKWWLMIAVGNENEIYTSIVMHSDRM